MSTNAKNLTGVIVPMITPLTAQGRIDGLAVERIVRHFCRADARPFVLGTTGESASLSHDLRQDLVRLTRMSTPSHVPVYAGISDNCLAYSLEAAKRFADLGVDAVVAHLPSYYPLNPEQILCYYERLADGVALPLVLYNIPSTTHMSIPLDVADKLSFHPRVIGMKDSERNLERLNASLELWAGRDDFSFLVGWARQSAYALARGARGIVPSTGNIVPGLYNRLWQAAVNGSPEKAQEYQDLTDHISELYQKERTLAGSLAALKVILSELGLCEEHVLPPLVPVTDLERQSIVEGVTRLNLRATACLPADSRPA
ncbi:MAG TPA: dihydrodipicolinate synthase family protein [Acidobacteriota bacterium]|nr:dihydrodipicolinate synthase family protein [Acidobacteriota bacterium]